MSIFKYLDYRKWLEAELEERRKHQPGFTQTRLAQQSGVRNTYLTNVIKGRANFNSDQIYAVAQGLGLNLLETDFLMLLKELDQSVVPERQRRLREDLEALRRRAEKTEARLTTKTAEDDPVRIMRYYGDPYLKIVHVLAQIPRYAKEPARIGEELRLRPDYLEQLLQTLVELEVIAFRQKKIEVLRKNYHLPKESPMLLPHQILMRAKSAERLQQVPADRRYSFSVTMSTTEETRRIVQDEFLEYLKRIEKSVKESAGENVYQINFDLFPWTD